MSPKSTLPIVLVVHSLGGLVAKKALCLSEQSIEAHEQQLHNNIVGIAFLGTPHRGSGIASYATGVARILKAAHKRVNTDILALLRRDSEVLADIDSSFGVWLRKKRDTVALTCFSEEHELPGIGTVGTMLRCLKHV
jgi:protein SERAC1